MPQSTNQARGPQAAPTLSEARHSLNDAIASRRRQRSTLWQDSSVFHDSFFGSEPRSDLSTSEFGALRSSLPPLRDLDVSTDSTPRPFVAPAPPPVRH